jgi:glutamate-1-semialdehyde 2,1-aminomutase
VPAGFSDFSAGLIRLFRQQLRTPVSRVICYSGAILSPTEDETMERPHMQSSSFSGSASPRQLARSAELFEAARRVMPGGGARPVLNFPPHPIFAARGEGCYITDADGNRYLDLHNNFAALVLGHRHPAVVDALRDQLERGLAFGAPSALESELARIIVHRVKSIEKVTFTNSGTEASMTAIALARAYSGRRLVAKFEGGYHGFAEPLFLSVRRGLNGDNGSDMAPKTVGNSPGIPPEIAALVVTLPYNNVPAVTEILTRRADEFAAVIVEPVQVVGGTIPPDDGFLEAVQSVARRLGILLIVDEVVTFRLAAGGAQHIFGLQPDLTVMGKIIGGGMPAGAVGGRAAIMDLLDPALHTFPVWNTGTFSGNPMTMAAGAAALTALTQSEIDRINRLGDQLRVRLNEVCETRDLPVSLTGCGSLLNLHFTPDRVHVSRDTWSSDREAAFAFFKAMLSDGFYLTTRGSFCLTTPMTDSDVERFYETALRHLDARREAGSV